MEPKNRPKPKDEDFHDDCITPQKNAPSLNRMKSRSLHFNLAGHTFASTSSPAEFGRDQRLESSPTTPSSPSSTMSSSSTTPSSLSSTASSQPADFWDTPEQKGPKFNSSAKSLTPPIPSIASIPSADGKQVFEPLSPTPRSRSGLLSTKEVQRPVRARNLVTTTTNLTSATGYLNHYDASAEEITGAGIISNKPALGDRDPSPLIKPVQRVLFPQGQPGIPKQEPFESLDVEDSIELPIQLDNDSKESKPSECLDIEDSIGLPSVASKVKKIGRSNPQPQEPARPRQQRAHSKSSECLGGHCDVSTEETNEAETISNKPALGNRNPSPLKKPDQTRLFPQEQPKMPKQESFESLDVEGGIELPSVASKVKKSGSNPQPQEPAGQRQQRAHSNSSECLDVEDKIKLSPSTTRVKGHDSGDSPSQDPPTVQKQEVHTKDPEGSIPQDAEPPPSALKTERSGCDDSLQNCSTASHKLLEALNQQLLSQRPKSQSQDRGLTLKKPSELRSKIDTRGQEPENAENGIYFRTKVFKTDDRTRPKSSLLYADGKIHEISDLRVGKCVGFTPQKSCNNPIKKFHWETNFSTLEEKINKRGYLDWEGEIHQIAEILFCYHHKHQASDAVKTLRTDYEKWIGTDESGPIQSEIDSSSRDMPQGKGILYIPRGPATRSQTKGQAEEKPILETSTRIFKPYPEKRQNLADCIREVIIKDLSRKDTMDGLIYIYWIPGNQQIPKGLVKIGVTNVTVASRLEEGRGGESVIPN